MKKNIVTIDGVRYKIVTPVEWNELDTMGRSVAVIEGRTTFLKEINSKNEQYEHQGNKSKREHISIHQQK